MIIVTDNLKQGARNDTSYLTFVPIKSGEHIGKFATSENALKEFPEIFKELEYEVAELEPKDFEIDLTPPTLYKLGVVIPDTFIWVFPDNKFILEGFEIPLTNGAVDIAYFQWQAFRDCLDNGNHDYLKRALMPLWDCVAEQVENQNFVQL
jgi:hypothetical protein